MVELEDVAFRDGVEALQGDAALVAVLHLAHVLLEAAQAGAARLGQLFAVAHDADEVVAQERAVRDVAAGDVTEAADTKYLAHLGVAVDYVGEDGLEHAG